MRSLRALIFAGLSLASCGRGELELLGGNPGGVGMPNADGSISGDDDASTNPLPDARGFPDAMPPPPRDGGGRTDGGGRRDAGFDAGTPDAGECASALECFDLYGRPPRCMGGMRGSWTCMAGTCTDVCGPVMCSDDCDCAIFEGCVNGTCRPMMGANSCCTNPICPPGQSCTDPNTGMQDVCPANPPDGGVRDGGRPPRPDGGPPASTIGDPCQNNPGACSGMFGFCIEENMGFPDGYCSQPCSMGPGGPGMCPPDSVCRDVGGGNSICLDHCTNVTDCRPDYTCVQLGLQPDRVCWPNPPASMNPNGAPVGADCSMNEDCDETLTCINLPNGPGGYCSKLYCDPMTNPCPTGSECYAFPGSFSLCLEQCPNGGQQSTCRTGYYCLGPTGAQGVCVGM